MVSAAPTARGVFAGRRVPAALIDATIAVAAFGGTVAVLAHGLGSAGTTGRHLDTLGVLLAACASLPLLAWRRHALAVFAASTAASAALNLLGYPAGPPIGPTVALYLLAASREGAHPWTLETMVAVVGLFAAHFLAFAIGHATIPGTDLAIGALVWAVAWFAGDRTRLRRAEIAELEQRARRTEQEAERERRLAAAEERARIARDLHDSAAHAINVIAVQAGAARLLADRDPPRLEPPFRRSRRSRARRSREIDQIVRTLRDGATASGGVEAPPGLAALGTLIDDHARTGLSVRLRTDGRPRSLAGPTDQAAYRILQEALTNAARHGTGTAEVVLTFGGRALDLKVINQCGRPTAALPRPTAVDTGSSGCASGRPCSAAASAPSGPAARSRSSPTFRIPVAVTRVLIADDDDLMRAGLAAVLSSDPTIEIVGEAATGRQAVERARRLGPDVVLMDIRMPDLDGIAATRELTAAAPDTRILILTTFEQDDYIFGGLRAGASGFLLKRTRPEELIAAVHTIAAGESLLSPSVTRRVIDRMAAAPDRGRGRCSATFRRPTSSRRASVRCWT